MKEVWIAIDNSVNKRDLRDLVSLETDPDLTDPLSSEYEEMLFQASARTEHTSVGHGKEQVILSKEKVEFHLETVRTQ